MKIDIWTDGSDYKNNTGPAGWACVLECGNLRKELSGSIPHQTNNVAELVAAIMALKAVKGTGHDITVYTDSQYVQKAIHGIRKPKANFHLLAEITRLIFKHKVTAIWIRGHSGEVNNARCDYLANEARKNDA